MNDTEEIQIGGDEKMSRALRKKPCTKHLIAPPNLKKREKFKFTTALLAFKERKKIPVV